ncbi:N-acetylmuramidase [Variovorax sp. J31P207]|uniref:glycoside hydrolase family 108 protein n=1 Tax=Variovorax sp. J31P207 TaxID=3053510 RepID=UPI00257592FA|nr:N-acetylmuramidase [Variovorax sp. J31P207]MDM0072072.1 glycosyl hydrolase 108 family protein [Variovorax sp. J31P207]
MTYDEAFQKLIGNEGGYVADPRDPGGETKYGVSKRSYPGEDIKNLTLERAKALYARDFWGPAGCDALPDLLKFEMFDLAVNTSAPGKPATAIKLLQQAVGSFADGSLGPNTLQAAQSMDPAKALRRLQALRLRYYTAIPPKTRDVYLPGWVNRVADNMLEA